MLITRIELENIKSYKQFQVDFQRGATAISGSNGAGKTTLVEAIGYALFDCLPYKQDQFVREGEKYGRVVIHLLGSDDRPYVVERRCGSGASWTLYDNEANFRLEQRADVQDKLHELFGIERERSLESLFRDALGVPQGTFTSIFLQKASARKQTFDALLQIDDYRTASDYLLEVQRDYRDQLLEQEREIQRLTFETRDLDDWRAALKKNREIDQELKTHNVASVHRLGVQQNYFVQLKPRQLHLQLCETQREQSKLLRDTAQQQREQARMALEEAQTASQIVQTNQLDYHLYREAEETLARLRQEERQRNTLRQRHASLNNVLLTTQANLQHVQQRLSEVAQARQLVLELIPSVEQQVELEKLVLQFTQEVQQYEALLKEGRRIHQLREKCQQEQAKARQRVTEIEPLGPLAEQLGERVARVAQLQTQLTQRTQKRLQLEEKRQLLKEKHENLEQTLSKLRKAEDMIVKIEGHRQEAEEFPLLQARREQLALRQHHLHGNIESYTDSRARSAGGQCPLLHQTCINIKQQGQLSLEAYFDTLLADEEELLHEVSQQLMEIEGRSSEVKKYADALDKLGQYVERREGYAEHIERLNVDLKRLEREVQGLQEEWEEFKLIDQEIAQAKVAQEESQQADKLTRQLSALNSKIEQLQNQIEQYTVELDERKRETEPLKQSRELLAARQADLINLNDPRSQSKAQQEIIKPEGTYRRQREQAQETLYTTESQMAELSTELATYEQLDTSLIEQESNRKRTAPGHQLYLKSIETAGRLTEREQRCAKAEQKWVHAAETLVRDEESYEQASNVFNEQEFHAVDAEIRTLEQTVTRLATEMQNIQLQINQLEAQITATEALLIALEAAQKEKQTIDELATMLDQFRKLLKEAGPYVLRAILNDISAEANRIFGEVMGDRSAQLAWTDDYEISLLRQGVKRSFAQLSGGEQMSAALAIRLALLKKLSTINIAFFDEPTQNMDEQRRVNLAEQIRRVRGFDQLIVISHDDTFEQGLDSLIRLRKVDGQTRLLTEDDDRPMNDFHSGQVNVYAS